MATNAGIGTVRAAFEADTRGFDVSVQGTSEQLKAAALAAEAAGDKIAATGEKIDRAAQLQERAAERARQAWQKELQAQDRAAQADAESARAKELAALKADILSRSLEGQARAQAFVNEATGHAVPQMAAASAAVKALEGNLTHNIRAGERFLTNVLGWGPALAAAFPVIGALALVGALVSVGAEVVKFGKEARDLAQELNTNWLDGAILQLEGFGDKVKEDIKAMQQFQGEIDQTLGSRKELAYQDLGRREGPLAEASARAAGLRTQATGLEAMEQSQREKLRVASALANPFTVVTPELKTLRDRYGVSNEPAVAAQQADTAREDLKATEAKVQELREQASKLIAEAAVQQESKWSTAGNKEDRAESAAQRAAEEAARRAGAERDRQWAYQTHRSRPFERAISGAKRYDEQQETAPVEGMELGLTWAKEQGEDVLRVGERWAQYNRELARGKEEEAAAAARMRELQISAAEATGSITPHAAAMLLAAEHAKQYAAQLQVLREELKRIGSDVSLTGIERATQGAQVRNQIGQITARSKEQEIADQRAIEASSALGKLQESAMRLAQNFTDVGAHLAQVMEQTLNDLNGKIVDAMSGKKGVNFNEVGANLFRGVARTGLESIEGNAMTALFGKDPHAKLGTKNNPMYVKDADTSSSGAGGTGGGLLGKLLGAFLGGGSGGAMSDVGAAGASSAGSAMGSIGGALLSGLAGFADGGPIPSNMPAIVGENGPEVFMPRSAGRIIPNQMAFGGGHTFNMSVDARGSNDPAAVEATVHRAMGKYMAVIPAMTVAAVRDHNARSTKLAKVGM